jgi:hypothetical protein
MTCGVLRPFRVVNHKFLSSNNHSDTQDAILPSPSLTPQPVERDCLTLPGAFDVLLYEEGFGADLFPQFHAPTFEMSSHSLTAQQPASFWSFP